MEEKRLELTAAYEIEVSDWQFTPKAVPLKSCDGSSELRIALCNWSAGAGGEVDVLELYGDHVRTRLYGGSSYDSFGYQIDLLDGGGTRSPLLIVAAPSLRRSYGGADSEKLGAVLAFDLGVIGQVEWQFLERPGTFNLGEFILALPDLDGDGVSDLVVTERIGNLEDPCIRVAMLSGSDGDLMAVSEIICGISYVRALDCTPCDPDVAMASPASDLCLFIYGFEGTVRFSLPGLEFAGVVPLAGYLEGAKSASLGLNCLRSQFSTLLWTDLGMENRSRVSVVTGAGLREVAAWTHLMPGHVISTSVIGDLDGDGLPDVLIGYPQKLGVYLSSQGVAISYDKAIDW